MTVLIKEVDVENGPFQRPLTIAYNSNGNPNWITVLIGENGSRKSYLLRLIHANARGASSFRTKDGDSVKIDIPGATGNPASVVAISGRATDRFSHLVQADESYTYLGLRSTNGASGYHQSEHCLVSTLLKNRKGLFRRRGAFKKVFAHLGLQAKVDVFFRIGRRMTSFRMLLAKGELTLASVNAKLREVAGRAVRSNKAAGQEIIAFIESSQAAGNLFSALTEISRASSYSVSRISAETPPVRLIGGRLVAAKSALPVSIWASLLALGIVDVDGTRFHASKENYGSLRKELRITGNDLSSGQWSWLNGFGGLCACLEDDTLILIDEPENSLHPSWQLEYVPSILSILEEFTGCHVIIATHSPLIQSGLPPDKGNVRTLTRGENSSWSGSPVQSIETVSTFGWSASDVYEEAFNLDSTRAPLFTEVADEALSLIADGRKISRKESNRLIESLEKTSKALQPLDPMRDVVDSVISELNQKK